MAGPAPSTVPLQRFGLYELDASNGELRRQGTRIKLDGQPLLILALLLQRAGEVVTREELRRQLWPDGTFVDFEHSINAAMKRLRRALDDPAEHPRYIQTLPRRGYRFICPMGAALNAVREIPADAFAPGEHSPSARRVIKSLAVLPLDNLSVDAEQDYFADGMTEELITELSRLDGAKVISRTSAMRYRHRSRAFAQIGSELGVEALLEGSVAREGRRVRVTVQLIEAATGVHLWAQRYERDLHGVLRLQTEVARQIAAELKIQLTSRDEARLAARPPVDPQAYELYLKGRYMQAQWATPENIRKAIALYDQAIAKDETFAAAHAARALGLLFLAAALIEAVPPREVMGPARAGAIRALELDPTCAEAYEALGWLEHTHGWRWEEAQRASRTAIELNPSYAPAHMLLAQTLNVQQRHQEALALLQRAHELDPLSLHVQWAVADTCMVSGALDRAAEECQRGLEMYPDVWALHTMLGNVHVRQERYDAAIAALRRGVELSGRHPFPLSALGSAYALGGRRHLARKIAAELEAAAQRRFISAAVLARLYASLGDNQKALAWLNRACDQRSAEAPRVRLWGPMLGSLASEPSFQDVLRRVNLA